jgi:hypothetical protein
MVITLTMGPTTEKDKWLMPDWRREDWDGMREELSNTNKRES